MLEHPVLVLDLILYILETRHGMTSCMVHVFYRSETVGTHPGPMFVHVWQRDGRHLFPT